MAAIFADDRFLCIFRNENIWISLKISPKIFLRLKLTIFQHWFRYWLGADQATNHYLNQWWVVYWRIFTSLGLNECRNMPNNPTQIQRKVVVLQIFQWNCCIHYDVIKWKHFRVTGHLCGEFTRHRWIPCTKASIGRGALMFSLICALNWRLSKQWWGWWFETPSRHYNVTVMFPVPIMHTRFALFKCVYSVLFVLVLSTFFMIAYGYLVSDCK